MTFLDEQIERMKSIGEVALGFDEVEPVPDLPDGLLYEFGLWFDQRMPYRAFGTWAPIGIGGEDAGNWMEPKFDTESPTYLPQCRAT